MVLPERTRPESDLRTLLGGMDPILDPRRFVFVSIEDDQAEEVLSDAMMLFREAEGTTAIVEEDTACALSLHAMFPCRMITLRVHSALDAVGFLAAILPELAMAGMGVNPVSAFHHDHLFVPAERADDALAVLGGIADRTKGSAGGHEP